MISNFGTAPAALLCAIMLTACSSEPDKAPAPASEPASNASQGERAAPPDNASASANVPTSAESGAVRPAIQSYEIVATHPHDPRAFTQGLFYQDGLLYESTGQFGESTIRKTEIDTGNVIEFRDLPPEYFGEGITRWEDKIYALTWQSGIGFQLDLETLQPLDVFNYPGEGWGLTANDTHLIQSDGSSLLRFIDPATFAITSTLTVKLNGKPMGKINELEWINGEIWANVWQSELIARINPETGNVTAVVDFTGLTPATSNPLDNVLNGIAYDRETGRIWITGKRWPNLYEIKVTDFGPPAQ